jgi:hypothetical protein
MKKLLILLLSTSYAVVGMDSKPQQLRRVLQLLEIVRHVPAPAMMACPIQAYDSSEEDNQLKLQIRLLLQAAFRK